MQAGPDDATLRLVLAQPVAPMSKMKWKCPNSYSLDLERRFSSGKECIGSREKWKGFGEVAS